MSESASQQSRDLLRRLKADPAAAAVPDPILLQAWQAISSELLSLIDHIDEDVDPVVKILGALVGGFHGIEPEVETEMRGLFALGAEQRARLERLEDQTRELVRAVAELKAAIRDPACALCGGSSESDGLRNDSQGRFRRQPQLRRLTAALVPEDAKTSLVSADSPSATSRRSPREDARDFSL